MRDLGERLLRFPGRRRVRLAKPFNRQQHVQQGGVAALLLLSCLALQLGQGGIALAQSSGNRPLAESLFQEGRALMDAGDPARACQKFAESQRLESGLGTLLNLGACYEALGKTASAWAEFSRALALAERDGDSERATLAERKTEELSVRLARLTLLSSADSGKLEIRIDDHEVGSDALGSPLPLDPGPHVIVVNAPNRRRWQSRVELEPGPSELVVEIPLLAPLVTPSPALPAPLVTPSPNGPAPQASGRATPSESSGNAIWIWTSLGVSAGAITLGTLATLDFQDQRALIREHCDAGYCTPQGMVADEQARRSAALADVSFGVGILAGLAAGYLWYSDSDDEAAGVQLSPLSVDQSPGLGVRGHY